MDKTVCSATYILSVWLNIVHKLNGTKLWNFYGNDEQKETKLFEELINKVFAKPYNHKVILKKLRQALIILINYVTESIFLRYICMNERRVFMTTFDFFIRLSVALLQGGVIGLERQWRQKSAGLRTNTLVALGASAFIMLGLVLTDSMGDPSRIASQIVTGIGFLGAGVIIKDGLTVQGLNTAATIWCSAAVGTFAGLGLWIESSILTLAIVCVNMILRPIVIYLNNRPFSHVHDGVFEYVLSITCHPTVEKQLREKLIKYVQEKSQLIIRSIDCQHTSGNEIVLSVELLVPNRDECLIETLVNEIAPLSDVSKIKWLLTGKRHWDI